MSGSDLSIIIVHAFAPRMVRQTLRGIRRAAPKLNYEVIVVDNTTEYGLEDVMRKEFPDMHYIPMESNRGFGAAMNAGIARAKGKYVLIFNPDIVVQPGSLEALYRFMEDHEDIGIVGPKLENPDGTLQDSCYRFHEFMVPVYRRTPLGKLPWGKAAIGRFVMSDFDHARITEVDWLIGAALFTRRSALDSVGHFDDKTFFLYLEDTDLCRRFWENGYRVVYNPEVSMVHYHRRASNDGNIFHQLFRSRANREHIKSWLKYFWKYRGKKHPRHAHPGLPSSSGTGG